MKDDSSIIIASDHAGFTLKCELIHYLKKQRFMLVDLGCSSNDAVDYPDFAKALCAGMSTKQRGILICGSGIGMAISANRFSHIRAALCLSPELAKLAREHNDANVLVLGARFIDLDTAIQCVDIFLATSFQAGKHQLRIDKLTSS